MMNKEHMQEWVKALRSGQYKQGRYILRTQNDEFCCLGVACDLYNPRLWFENKYSGRQAFLSNEVNQHFGIGENDGFFMWLNDTKKVSFNVIADEIEALIASEKTENYRQYQIFSGTACIDRS